MLTCLKNRNKIESIIFLLYSIVIGVVFLRYLSNVSGILVINDEFGYWGIAAQIAGKDWTSLLSTTPYYSYGYSLLLVPLFLLNLSPVVMYQVAIVFNAVFILGSFYLAYSCGRKLFPKISSVLMLTICLVITFYTSNILQAQIAWSETLLYFLYWLLLWLLLHIIDTPKLRSMIGFVICSFCLYIVHQRSIGVVLSVGIVMLMLFVSSGVEKKKFLYVILSFAIIFLLHGVIKNHITSQVFTTKELVQMNDYSGQMGKFKVIFGSWHGFSEFLKSIAGKFYYLGVSTFLLAYSSAWYLGGESWLCLQSFVLSKGREFDRKKLASLFVFLSFGATFLVNAISMNSSTGRLDLLVYGRYMEFAIGPVLLMGCAILIENKKTSVQMALEICILGLMAILVHTEWVALNVSTFNYLCASTLSYFFLTKTQISYLAYWIAIFSGVIATGTFLIRNLSKKAKWNRIFTVGALAVFAAGWLFLSANSFPLQQHQNVEASLEPILTAVKKWSLEENIYVLKNDDGAITLSTALVWGKYIQYHFPDELVNWTDDPQEINEAEHCLIVYNNGETKLDDYIEAARSNCLSVFVRVDSQIAQSILQDQLREVNQVSLEDFSLTQGSSFVEKDENTRPSDDVSDSSYILTDGTEAIDINGPLLPLDSGTYRATFDLEFIEGGQQLGQLEIRLPSNELLSWQPIKRSDFDVNGRLSATVEFPISLAGEVTFSLHLQNKTEVRITDVTYQKIDSHYVLFGETSKSLQTIRQIMDIIPSDHELTLVDTKKQLALMNTEYLKSVLKARSLVLREKADWQADGESLLLLSDSSAEDIYEIYSLLDRFTVLARVDGYYLLMKTDSALQSQLEAAGYSPLSDGRQLTYEFYLPSGETNCDYTKTVSLPRGVYQFDVQLEGSDSVNSLTYVEVVGNQGGERLENVKGNGSLPWKMHGKYCIVAEGNDIVFQLYTTANDVNVKRIRIKYYPEYEKWFEAIKSCYSIVLNRGSDDDGTLHWLRQVINNDMTIDVLTQCFLFSEERAMNYPGIEAFIEVSYRILCNREATQEEKSHWTGYTEEEIFEGLIQSDEYHEVWKDFLP